MKALGFERRVGVGLAGEVRGGGRNGNKEGQGV